MGDEDEFEWEEDDDEDLRRPPDIPRPEGEPLSADDEDRLLSEGRRSLPQRPRKRGRYRRTTREDYNPFPVDEEGNVIGVPVNYGPPIETLPEGMASEPAEDSTGALLSMFQGR
jgi:hypothetical protein